MKLVIFLFALSFTVFFSDTVIAQNWHIQNSNFPADVLVVDFSSVNEQVCWAVGQVFPGSTTPYAGYIRTTNGGITWVCDTIPGLTDTYSQQVFAIDANTAFITVYVLSGQSSKGIYKTTNGGTTWTRQTAYNTSLYGPGIMHFFDSQNGVVIGDPNLETYTTTNGGLTWSPVTMPAALPDEETWLGESRITAVGNTVWFPTNRRLFKSTDKGYTWTVLVNEPQNYDWLPSISFQDNLTGIYALKISGYGTDHIYRKTTDGGVTWSTLSNPVLNNLAPSCIQHIPGTSSVYIAAGGRTPTMRGTAVTYDAGESWTLIDTLGVFVVNFYNKNVGWGSQFGTNVVWKYVGAPLPVELSSFTAASNGKEIVLNWSTATELNNLGFEIQRSSEGKKFFAVGFVNGYGTTAGRRNYSFADKILNNGTYYYRLKQVDHDGSFAYSDVAEVDFRAFNSYILEQNFPNPFNPSTTIAFGIQDKSNVRITILNAVGEEAAVILNEEREPGYHKVEFNAANLPSGIYFYQLKTKDFISTKKMILMK